MGSLKSLETVGADIHASVPSAARIRFSGPHDRPSLLELWTNRILINGKRVPLQAAHHAPPIPAGPYTVRTEFQ